jgi:hypothetical protein
VISLAWRIKKKKKVDLTEVESRMVVIRDLGGYGEERIGRGMSKEI